MDEKDKKIAELESKVTDLTATVETLTADKEALHKTVTEKDAIIAQKNNDLVGQRKKFSELTEQEKAEMTEKEKELQQRQEELDNKITEFETRQQESLKKEVDARKAAAIKKYAGNDPELAKKIEDNYSRILDADKAQTEEEVSKIVGEAFNMTGTPKPSSLENAVNSSGYGDAPGNQDAPKFSETEAGQGLAGKLGLPPPKAS